MGGRERKKKDIERSSELECKKIAPAIFNDIQFVKIYWFFELNLILNPNLYTKYTQNGDKLITINKWCKERVLIQ